MRSICLRTYVLTFFALLAFVGAKAQCPMVFSPVTGKNNVTYLNACFAEAANENFYTEGVAFGDCIESALMDPNVICGTNYDPVVGCNGAIYLNACEAQKHGVTSFMPQSSMVNGQEQIDDCFDYQIVANAFPGAFNYANGTLTVNCPGPSLPVCGCNGIDYSSACEAEASGVVDYTYGTCGDQQAQNPQNQCIDQNMVLSMEPDNCPLVYRPVCGCNDMTYINECAAENSGVMQTISGACGNFAWRNNATTLITGQSIDGNTSGRSNLISNYSSCTTVPLVGPEDVYVIHKTTPGDLQVYLEIQDPSIDLDIFVMDGMNTGQCLGQSIGPVGGYQEGLVINDAPIGTYYIIVDAQFANSAGAYTLQTGSGYLDTRQAVEIDCGVPMQTSNATGNNNMLAFNCSSRAEVSGPEMIYTFSIINDAVVEIDLFNMTADMNMFLLNQLDLQNCVGSSQRIGMGAERIALPLTAGTYYIVVDGGAGATGDYMLNVNCNNAQCDQNLEISAESTDCNTATGRISIQNLGSTNSEYVFSLEGPVSGCAADGEGEEDFENLPVGKYMVYSMDGDGCNQENEVTVTAGAQGFFTNISTSHNGGINGGQIDLQMTGGFPPFEIFLNGTSFGTTNNNTFTIPDLPDGIYDVEVMDASQCEQARTAAITNPCSLYTTLVPTDQDCGGLGSVSIDVYNGTPPFNITLNGVPAIGNPYAATWIGIYDLTAGLYTVVLTDANGCSDTQVTTINYAVNNITLVTTPTPQTCSSAGSIAVTATGGVGPYTVTLDGSPAGSYPGPNFTISNVSAGAHTLVVTDSYSCTETTSVTVGGSSTGVSITSATPTAASCTSLGSAAIVVSGGTAPYVVTVNGAAAGTYTTATFTLAGLATGTNNIVVTDGNGCTDNTSITIGGSTTGVSITSATPTAASCASAGSAAIVVTGGTAPYVVTANGAAAGTYSTTSFTLSGLAPGTYAIVVTDANGCTDNTSVTIGGSTTGVSITSATPTAASCASPGSAVIAVAGGTAPYAVTVNGTAAGSYTTSTFTLTGLPTGTHAIVVTDANGCTDNTSITIGGSTGGVSIVTATPTAASCSSTGSIAVDVTGGTAPYAVTLNGDTVVGSPFATTWFDLTGLVSGSYTMVVTDANGCSDTTTVTVGNNGGNITLVATPTPAGCNGSTGSISVAATGGVPPFAVSVNGTPMGTASTNPIIINSVPAGTYSISITDANGCTGSTTSTVTGGAGGVAILTATPTAGSCSAPGSIGVDVSGGTSPYAVTLNGAAAGTYNNTWFAVPAAPGTYTMVVTDANGCSDTTTVTVGGTGGNLTLTPTPTPAGCNGSYGSISVAVAGGAAPYAVSINGSYVSTTSNNPFNIVNAPAGTYTISITDANGCTGTTTSTITGGAGGVTILTATPTAGSCSAPGSIGVDVSGGTAPYTVTLNGAGAGTYNNTWFAVPAAPGTYTMIVTDANGCSDTTTVTVTGTGGNVTLTPTSTPAGCNGGYGSILVAVAGGSAPFAVSINGSYVSTTSNNPFNIVNVPAGTHTISITDANGCTGTTSSTVGGSASGITILTATPTSGSCAAPGSIGVDVSGGLAPYTVTLNGTAAGVYNNTWFAVPAAPGTYTMVVTDANGCSDTTTVTVGGSTAGVVTILTAAPTAGSCSTPGSIGVDVSGGTAPYTVTLNNAPAGTYNATWFAVPASPGTYTMVVTDANGCSDTTTVTVGGSGSGLTLTPTATTPACGGYGTITIAVAGGTAPFAVSVNGSAVGNSSNNPFDIVNVPAGTYTVSVTDANGCTGTTSATVTGGGTSKLIATGNASSATCSGGMIQLDIVGGTPTFDVYVDGTFITNTNNRWYIIQNVAAGTHTVKIVDANGCEDDFNINVTGGGGSLSVTATPSVTGCGYGIIGVDVIGGVAPYTVTLNGSVAGTSTQTWFNIVGVPSGSYTLVITDANGCTGSTPVTVPTSSGSSLTLTANAAGGSCNSSGSIALDYTGGTAPYEIFLDGTLVTTTNDTWYTIPNVSAGTHIVKVVDKFGCEDASSVTVAGAAGNLTVGATSTPGSCSGGGMIKLDINGGTPPFEVELNGVLAVTTNDRWYTLTNIAPGGYDILVTDANGCTATHQEVVGNSGGTNLSITGTGSAGTCAGGSILLSINGSAGPFEIEVDGVFITSTNDRSYTITNVAAGNRVVTVTDKAGCSKNYTVAVPNPSGDLVLYTSATNGTCGNTGSIFFDINGGVGPWDVFVNGTLETNTANRWHDLPNLAPGIYDIEIVGPNGCTASRADTVEVNDDLFLYTSATNGTCGSTGSIFFDINGGVGPWDVFVNGTLETNTANRWHDLPNLAPGIYDIEIVGPNGCTASRADTVEVDSDLFLYTSATNAACGGNGKGSIFFDINGGVGPWDVFVNGTLETNTANRWHDLPNLAPGIYDIEIVGPNGCTATRSDTVEVDSGLLLSTDVTDCGCGLNNGRIELDVAGGTAPFDVFLNGTLEYNNVNNRFPVFRDLAPGTYTARVVDKFGCENSVTVEVDDSAPAEFTVNANNTSCSQNNGSIDINITSGLAPYEIFLDGAVIGTANGNTYSIMNLTVGNYQVGVRDAKGCESVRTAKISGGGSVSLQTNAINGNCAANGSINLTITGGTAPFDILVDGNLVTNTSDRNYQITDLANGSYTVRVVDANGCDVSANQNVSVVTSNITLNGSPTASGCGLTNGSISLTMTGGTAPYDIYIDGALSGSTLSNTYNAGGLAAGTYNIRIVDANACEKSTQQTVTSSGGINVTTNNTVAAGCNGMTGSITMNINSGLAPYDVYVNGTFITTTNNNSYTAAGLSGGTYTIEFTDANNCSGSVTETIQQFSNLTFNASAVDAGCGTTNGSITVSDIVGTPPYTIFLNGSSVAATSDPTFTLTGLSGGTYVVAVSDANACDGSQSLVIAGSASNITLSATTFPENCDAADGNITLDIQGGVGPFEVYMDGVLLATTNDRWYNIMDLTVGTYFVRVVDVNGCEATGTFTVGGNTAINVATTSTNGSCGATNGTITVDATGGLAPYTIYMNGVNQGTTFNQSFTIAGVVPGTYDIRVVDANGCETTNQETVGGASSFAATATATNISCGTLGSILVEIQTGTAPYDIYVNGNPAGSTADATFNISNLNTGDYDVRIVDANSCEDTKKVTIAGSNNLDFNATAEPDACGNNGAIFIEFLNGVAPYSIELDGVWVANAPTSTFRLTNLVSGGYIVKVTDANGCSEEMVVMINNMGMAPNPVFTYIFTPGGIVKFFSNNPGGTVAWDFDDGSTSVEVNPIHQFAVGNTYKVCMTATNSCGTAEHCETVIIPTVYSSNLSFTAGTVSGRPGETIAIPVEVDNFDRVMSFQYTVQLSNGTVGKIVDVQTDDMNELTFDILSDDMVTLHWESNDADGMSLPNDHTIFNVLVDMTGNRGSCATVEFPTTPMNIEVRQRWFSDPTLVVPNFFGGEVCVNDMVNISGKVVREDNEPIPNVEMTCNSSQTAMNDAITGEYEFNGSQMGSSCLILPTKDGDDNMGLSVMDLIKMRRHIMDVTPFDSPYKIIASDVNRDKNIDANDMSIVGDLILGNQDQMFQGDSWRFLPAGWSFTDPEEPFAPLFPVMINLMNLTGDMYDQDFMGMKLGDVDNSLNMPTMTDNMNMNGQLTFHTPDQAINQGEEFVLEITSSDFNNVCGFQLELNYDPARFEFVEMLAGDLPGLPQNMVGTAHTNDGILTVLWYDKDLASSGISHDGNDVLYRLKFTATQGFNSLAGLFEIGQAMTHSVGVNIGNQYLDVDFNIDGATTSVGETEEAAFTVEQNHPNPFSDQTFIGFTLPSPQTVDFELVDQQGRVIKRTQQLYNKGYQQIIVDGNDLSTSGIYFYRLSVADKTVAKKLIFMKKR